MFPMEDFHATARGDFSMRADPMKFPLCSLLLVAAALACGEAPLEPAGPDTGGTPPVGSQEAMLCGGLSVTTLTLLGASTYQGELAGSGSWAVSSLANGIRLEYTLDGVAYAAEEQEGRSGSWYVSREGVACGVLHSVQVKAFPMIIDSAGRRITCLDVAGSKSVAKWNVGEACVGNAPCDTCHFSGAVPGRFAQVAADHCPHGVLNGSGMKQLLERTPSASH
jgi:hypothetical protein